MPEEDGHYLASAMVFEAMASELPKYSRQLARNKALIVFHIKRKGKDVATYTMDLREMPGSVYEGEPKDGGKPKAVITTEDEHFAALALGELDPLQGFMSGKIKARGDVLMLQKLSVVLKGARDSLL